MWTFNILNFNFKRIPFIIIIITVITAFYQISIKFRFIQRNYYYSQVTFVTLAIHINYLCPSSLDREIFCVIIIYHIFLIASTQWSITWHIPPLIPFSVINNFSTSAKGSKFTLVFFKAACYYNPVAARERARSRSYISRQIFWKCSNTSLTIMYCFEHTNHEIP